MTGMPDRHDHDHADLAFMYALQALPADEMAIVERRIAACGDCRQEMETLRPIVDSLSHWPGEALSPSASLWDRLAVRVAEGGATASRTQSRGQWTEPDWKEAAPGISVKILATDTQNNRVTMLVRLAPGTDYPPHRHAGLEELHLLDGELMVDDRKLSPGDYNRAERGTVDRRVWTETGCTCLLVTSYDDVIL